MIPFETMNNPGYGCFDRWNGNGTLGKLPHRLRAARGDVGAINDIL